MRVVIISDIHDHIWNLEAVLQHLKETDALICCGDLCSPFIMGKLAREYSGPIHIVFGNNDADQFRITSIAAGYPGRVTLHGELAEITLDDKKVAVNHFDYIARGLAASGQYDAVFYGHNHLRACDKLTVMEREVLLLNPGTLMGVFFDGGQPRATESTFAIWNTQTDQISWYEVGENQEVIPFPFKRDQVLNP